MEDDTDGSEYIPEAKSPRIKATTRPTNASKQAARWQSSRHGVVQKVSSDANRKRSSSSGLKGRFSRGYLDLLNSEILDLGHHQGADGEQLGASQIGASFWSSTEKDAFFHQLRISGSGDLKTLSEAIGTKSAPEVQAYLLLLQEGVRELEASFNPREVSCSDNAHAAWEVSVETEDAANLAADAIAERVERDGAVREREKYGDWWLIDEIAAEELEGLFEDQSSAERSADQKDGMKTNAEVGNQVYTAFGPNEPIAAPVDLPMSAARLLRPANFLKLSKSLFMNSAINPDSNWQTHLDPDGDQNGPAIYRTAFDDFHNLAVSLTRRLVQASIFQALSRLRSASDSRLVPACNGTDVAAAIDIVGSKVNHDKYWATVARRCGVEVYSEAVQFKDGRPGTKRGSKLSYDEVERELGMSAEVELSDTNDDSSISDEAIDELDADDDAFTDASDSSELSPTDEHLVKDENDSTESRSQGRFSKTQTRKRALSPQSFNRAEDEYLEKLDQRSSTVEENRLRNSLGLEPLDDVVAAPLRLPFKRARAEARGQCWRDVVQYQAPWERHGLVPVEDFEAMDADGKQGRKQHNALRKAWEWREQGDSGQRDANVSSENASRSETAGSASDEDDAVEGAEESDDPEDQQ